MLLADPRAGESVPFHVYPSAEDWATLGSPEEITWSSIRQLCSLEMADSVARNVYGVKGKRNREDVARSVKLYIEQAWELYQMGRDAKPNTAPLSFYYSFLNLAKALCEFHYPRFHLRKESHWHGLSWRPNPRYVVHFPTETVLLRGRGVWRDLWESVSGVRCAAPNKTKIRISELFRLCPEVGIEVSRTIGGDSTLIDMHQPEFVYDVESKTGWIRFGVNKNEFLSQRLRSKTFLGLISIPMAGYVEVKSKQKDIRLFESQVSKPLVKDKYVGVALRRDVADLNVVCHLNKERNLDYSLPVNRVLPIRMPQLIVLYTIMFWLGSLVRYDPHSVRSLMDSKYWVLIDGFMTQSRLWLLELFEWDLYQIETALWVAR